MQRAVLPPGVSIPRDLLSLVQEGVIKYPKVNFLSKEKYRYIAIEGIDGVGKTTIASLALQSLRELGEDAELVQEPYTREIKNLLESSPDLDPVVEAMLFAADRYYLHSRVLSKLLAEGKTVISDRSYVASLVYQVVRGAPEEFVLSINYFAIRPSMVILLDVPSQVALERLSAKGGRQLKHLERPEFLETLRSRYFEVLKTLELPYEVIDARGDVYSVLKRVIDAIAQSERREKSQ